jgi:phospho-N-acetylmuramoyl-pentapeptide-transferase
MFLSQWHSVFSGLIPFLFSLLVGPRYIRFLKNRYMGQYIREEGPQNHQAKKGTPTSGGVLILMAVVVAVVVLSLVRGVVFLQGAVVWVLGAAVILGALGFADDYLKIAKKNNDGISGYVKLAIQIVVGLLIGYYAWQSSPEGSTVNVFGLFRVQLGWCYPLFSALVVTATSNAVNLTDGLDGLAAGTSLLSFMTISLLLLAAGHVDLALLAQAFSGAALGFLMFNRHPARIFMGDTGSLALGGALAALAIIGHIEFYLLLVGAIFVLEALSVILQVASFKTTGKRLFKMSPIHHHFELSGWKETQVVYNFVTFQFLCCAIAIFLYNSRG